MHWNKREKVGDPTKTDRYLVLVRFDNPVYLNGEEERYVTFCANFNMDRGWLKVADQEIISWCDIPEY